MEGDDTMYKEIDLGDGNKITFFRNIDFWNNVLQEVEGKTELIDIVTYNFNFEKKGESSFYNKLLTLSEQGVHVRLMFSPKVSKDNVLECEDVFSSEILCVKVPSNHSKIFISDVNAFIGSANFSLGSNDNYECGFWTENKEMIKRLRKELITNSIFNVPGREIITCPVWNDPLSLLRETIRDVERTVI